MLPQRAYVWQRVWTPAVCRAVHDHGGAFAALDVLGAEISFTATGPRVSEARPNWRILREARVPVAVVVRIGACRCAWDSSAPETQRVVAVCRQVLAEAQANGVEPAELQIDFDAATARLRDYRALLLMLRQRVAPPRLMITTLPSWMDSADFRALIGTADAYVLQVHSLEPPTSSTAAYTLCDPVRAERWIAQAVTYGRPFRVALPTYAYRVGFAASGQFLGLQAEGAARAWPAGTILHTVSSDPVQLAGLVRNLSAGPPIFCEGVTWFRLPSEDDVLAWRWVTLRDVSMGVVPRPGVVLRTVATKDGTLDVVLANEGSADATVSAMGASWEKAQLVAADAVGGWRMRRSDRGEGLVFQPAENAAATLAPGESTTIGWLRLDRPAVVVAAPF